MSKIRPILTVCAFLFAGHAAIAGPAGHDALAQQVADTERAFANTMTQRDFAGFVSFLAEETIFFSGDTPLRGKRTVAETWKPYYEGDDAPFAWEPENVQVLDSGSLALSSGPVYDRQGKRVATFNSVWRLEPDGQWKIVFDKGCGACNCATP